MKAIFGAVFSRVGSWLAVAGFVIFAIGAAFLKGRNEGKRLMEAEQERARLDSLKRRKETDDEVENLGAADVDSAYKRWLRDHP